MHLYSGITRASDFASVQYILKSASQDAARFELLRAWFGKDDSRLVLEQFSTPKYVGTCPKKFLEAARMCVHAADSVPQAPVKALLKDFLKLREVRPESRWQGCGTVLEKNQHQQSVCGRWLFVVQYLFS